MFRAELRAGRRGGPAGDEEETQLHGSASDTYREAVGGALRSEVQAFRRVRRLQMADPAVRGAAQIQTTTDRR